MAHTPAPWEWNDNFQFSTLQAPTNDRILYYTTDDDGVHVTNPDDRPLIAAAPELLAMLKRVEACPMAAVELSRAGIFADLRAAIAKAEGAK